VLDATFSRRSEFSHKGLFVNPPKDRYNSTQLHTLEQEGSERFLAPPLILP
jgi:hypothetical protein